MILLGYMHLTGDDQVIQALTVIHLFRSRDKHLIPVCEMFHISVTIILVIMVSELNFVQQRG